MADVEGPAVRVRSGNLAEEGLPLYQAIVAIHVVAAVTWLGGMLFLVMVMVPLVRRDAGPGFAWLRQAAERFVPVAWISMVLLALTGGYLATDHWGIGVGDFFSGGIHFINILQIKTALFLVVILVSLAHDFWLGPMMMDRLDAARQSGQPPPRGPARTFVLLVARTNLVMVVAIVVLAVMMTRP